MYQYEGLVAATCTAFHEDRSINTDVIPPYVEFLLQQGVKGVFVNGGTGEWPSLSLIERMSLAERWLQHGKKRNGFDTIIIHCGAVSISDTKLLAKHAETNGADAIACIAPNVFKPENEECLVEYLKEVASVAPNMPFLYYHIPIITNVEINMTKFLHLAHEHIPTFCGMKYTSYDLFDACQALEFKEKPLMLFYGRDEQLLAAMLFGCKAAVGSLFNFLGKQYNSIIEATKRNDWLEASRIQLKVSSDIIPIVRKYGIHGAKAILTCISGVNMGPPRLPLKALTKDQYKELKLELVEKGYM